MMHGLPVTQKQTDYVRALQRALHLSDHMLDNHCVQRFGRTLADLDRAGASSLIDEMTAWKAIPAQLQREMGQRDLPGFGG